MEPLAFQDLPQDALILLDSAPIIYILEGHAKFAPRFMPLFEAHAACRLRFVVTTITITEVLAGPLRSNDQALARRYQTILESWQSVPLDIDIAESAARLRASLRLRMADPVQAASALAINAAALVTDDRDFLSRARAAHNLLTPKPPLPSCEPSQAPPLLPSPSTTPPLASYPPSRYLSAHNHLPLLHGGWP